MSAVLAARLAHDAYHDKRYPVSEQEGCRYVTIIRVQIDAFESKSKFLIFRRNVAGPRTDNVVQFVHDIKSLTIVARHRAFNNNRSSRAERVSGMLGRSGYDASKELRLSSGDESRNICMSWSIVHHRVLSTLTVAIWFLSPPNTIWNIGEMQTTRPEVWASNSYCMNQGLSLDSVGDSL